MSKREMPCHTCGELHWLHYENESCPTCIRAFEAAGGIYLQPGESVSLPMKEGPEGSLIWEAGDPHSPVEPAKRMTKYQQIDPRPGHGPLWREPDTARRAELRKAAYKAWQETTRLEAEDELRALRKAARRAKILFWISAVILIYVCTEALLRAMGEIR